MKIGMREAGRWVLRGDANKSPALGTEFDKISERFPELSSDLSRSARIATRDVSGRIAAVWVAEANPDGRC